MRSRLLAPRLAQVGQGLAPCRFGSSQECAGAEPLFQAEYLLPTYGGADILACRILQFSIADDKPFLATRGINGLSPLPCQEIQVVAMKARLP